MNNLLSRKRAPVFGSQNENSSEEEEDWNDKSLEELKKKREAIKKKLATTEVNFQDNITEKESLESLKSRLNTDREKITSKEDYVLFSNTNVAIQDRVRDLEATIKSLNSQRRRIISFIQNQTLGLDLQLEELDEKESNLSDLIERRENKILSLKRKIESLNRLICELDINN